SANAGRSRLITNTCSIIPGILGAMERSTMGEKSRPAEANERMVTPRQRSDDGVVERSLRPKRLAEYIGQDRVKGSLSIFIEAAKAREEPLDHVLLHGPPGLGKTTLASIIAAEMGGSLRITSGPAIERQGD